MKYVRCNVKIFSFVLYKNMAAMQTTHKSEYKSEDTRRISAP